MLVVGVDDFFLFFFVPVSLKSCGMFAMFACYASLGMHVISFSISLT